MRYKLIGEKIKRARNDKELTQEEMAEKLDVSVSFISQVESGEKKFNLDRIIQVSKILEKPIDYFVEGYKHKSNEVIDEIIEILKRMSSKKLKLFLKIIKVIEENDEDL